jgi:hypothetical protein
MMRSFMICTLNEILSEVSKSGIRWAEHVACMGEMRNVYKVSVRKSDGKRTLVDVVEDGGQSRRMYVKYV